HGDIDYFPTCWEDCISFVNVWWSESSFDSLDFMRCALFFWTGNQKFYINKNMLKLP
ncbi:hypothetical protein ACJX0J_023508, partial [Zea mays]